MAEVEEEDLVGLKVTFARDRYDSGCVDDDGGGGGGGGGCDESEGWHQVVSRY